MPLNRFYIFTIFQYDNHLYILRAISRGNWYDAEGKCRSIKGHLWSINSHSEWWHVLQTFGLGVSVRQGVNANLKTFFILTSILSFIGLVKHNEVKDCGSYAKP